MIGGLGDSLILAYCEPVDRRKGFEGLSGVVRNVMGQDPLCGAWFIFTNWRRTIAKVLRFDGTGLCVYAKRLACSVLQVPVRHGLGGVALPATANGSDR